MQPLQLKVMILVVVNGEIKPGLRTAETHQGKFTAKGVQWKTYLTYPAPKGKSQDGLAGALSGYSNGHYLVTGGANSSRFNQTIQRRKTSRT